MPTITGVIKNVRRDGKGFQLGNDEWYSAFTKSQLNGCNSGDSVEFTYTTTPPKGPTGAQYNNIKGEVIVKSGGFTVSRGPAAVPKNTDGFVNDKGFKIPMFPIPPLHPDRSIIRQNSLGHAVELLAYIGFDVHSEPEEDAAHKVINVARIFESYSTGEMDKEAADEMVKKMIASEHY